MEYFQRRSLAWLTFDRFSTALLFIAIGLGACFARAQSDTWWQLRAGQEIWSSGSIDLHDHFSHTVTGAYWPNHEWLSQVLFYSTYRVGGIRLLTALAASVIVAGWALIWRLTPGPVNRRLMLCASALVPSSMAWALRPQVLTLLLVATTASLVVRCRYWLLLPVFLVWANLHGGVTLGFALLAGGIVARTIDERRLPTSLLAFTAVCALITVITPLGVSLWTEVAASLARLRSYGVIEWRPPALTDPVFLPFWLFAAALVALAVRERPWRLSASRCGMTTWAALAMLPLALGSGRNVPPFMLIAVPGIAALLNPARSRPRATRAIERPTLNAAILGVVGTLAIATVTYAWAREMPRLGWHPLPEPAIAALASCPERLYNRYDEGGYVIWFVRGRKVFLDSRQDPYPPALVLDQIRVEASGDYATLFDRYAIGCAFVAADSPIARRLTASGWEATYTGAGLVVMARTNSGRVSGWRAVDEGLRASNLKDVIGTH